MSLRQKKIIIITVATILVLLLIIIGLGKESAVSQKSYDFVEEGNLVGQENGWGLLYEKPGAPALMMNLQFNNKSDCLLDKDKDKEICEPHNLLVGTRVIVKGDKKYGLVEVGELIIE